MKHLTRNRWLVDIFLTCRLSKSLAVCEFASVNFEPWIIIMCRVAPWEFWGRYPFFLAVTNLRGKLCQKFFQKQSQSAVGHNTDPVSRAAPKWLTPPHFVVPDVKKRSCPASCCNGVSLECCATRCVTTQTQKCRTHRTVLQYCPMFKKKKERKRRKTQWPVTWPPHNSEGCEGATL